MSERVVEFGTTRYEWVEDAQGGHWWPDVTPQERALVEELERQQEGIRTGAVERDRLRAELDELYAELDEVRDLLTSVAVDATQLRDRILNGLDEVDQ
jgi:predicted nuclease with TOPRIM domain